MDETMEGPGPLRQWLRRHGVDAESQVVIENLYKVLTKATWSDPCLALAVSAVDRATVLKGGKDLD
jgi:hypothetical protein